MLIPRFSLKAVLLAFTGFGVLSLVVSGAIQGNRWALGAVIGLSGIAMTFVFLFLAFAFAFVIAAVFNRGRTPTASPFTDEAPKQVLPTHDVD